MRRKSYLVDWHNWLARGANIPLNDNAKVESSSLSLTISFLGIFARCITHSPTKSRVLEFFKVDSHDRKLPNQ